MRDTETHPTTNSEWDGALLQLLQLLYCETTQFRDAEYQIIRRSGWLAGVSGGGLSVFSAAVAPTPTHSRHADELASDLP